MSIVYTADVFCNACGNWEHGVTQSTLLGIVMRSRKAATQQGWKVKALNQRHSIDLCPTCAEAKKEKT